VSEPADGTVEESIFDRLNRKLDKGHHLRIKFNIEGFLDTCHLRASLSLLYFATPACPRQATITHPGQL